MSYSPPKFTPRIAFDFDGVIHQHVSKWTVAREIHDPPVEGAIEALESCYAYGVVPFIFTARADSQQATIAIREWLKKYGFSRADEIVITNEKLSAIMYIDDRAFRFEGVFPRIPYVLAQRPWNKLPELVKRESVHPSRFAEMSKRQTGRTERMLKEALYEFRKEHNVLICAVNDVEAERLGSVLFALADPYEMVRESRYRLRKYQGKTLVQLVARVEYSRKAHGFHGVHFVDHNVWDEELRELRIRYGERVDY